ncbi:DUF4369 domain-containing protein [Corallibacter sp.]|uniref:DUF4369 domain-containing protein n=1 Tax=Corallibacter sp. TaxID=2038084 RepID=UPI003A94A3ED
MKKLAVLLIAFIAFSCGKENHNLTVKGHVKGLKKGTVYLERAQDSILVIADSLALTGNSDFELHANIDEPEAFYLRLDRNNTNEKQDKIVFFADKGMTEINTTLKNFVFDATITGSKQQTLYNEYLTVLNRFGDRNLDLIKENLEAKQMGDSAKIASSERALTSLLKSKYLYTVNFAVTNNDSEISPYLALTEIYDAQTKWLDTINNALTPRIKNSMYGKTLQNFLEERKASEE